MPRVSYLKLTQRESGVCRSMTRVLKELHKGLSVFTCSFEPQTLGVQESTVRRWEEEPTVNIRIQSSEDLLGRLVVVWDTSREL